MIGILLLCLQDDLALEKVRGKPMEFEIDEDLPGYVCYIA